jgi:hypothetical protein
MHCIVFQKIFLWKLLPKLKNLILPEFHSFGYYHTRKTSRKTLELGEITFVGAFIINLPVFSPDISLVCILSWVVHKCFFNILLHRNRNISAEKNSPHL